MAGDEPYEVELKRLEVPHYAAHLAAAGNTLPGFARESRLDKVQIDWPAAAMANPGVGIAPSADARKAATPTQAMSTGGAGAAPTPPQTDTPPPIDGVTWDQFAAIEWGFVRDKVKPKDWDTYAQQHGVAPGAWAGAAKQWNLKMRKDPALCSRSSAQRPGERPHQQRQRRPNRPDESSAPSDYRAHYALGSFCAPRRSRPSSRVRCC